MDKAMTSKMEEGFKSKRLVRQEAQNEIKQMVQNDMDALKEEMKNLKMGSGSTVCSEASINSHSISKSFFGLGEWSSKDGQKITSSVVSKEWIQNFIADMEKMILERSHKYFDWEQTKSEQGPWPTKNMVSVWFRSETNLVVMIELLRIVKEELRKGHYTIKGSEVVPRLESS